MRRPPLPSGPSSALGLFAVFAAVSLVPVLVLGLVLAASYRSEASDRGLSEGRAQAGLFAHTAVEPLLADVDLRRPLTGPEVAELDRISRAAVANGEIVRFRVRALDGRIRYSSDRSAGDPTDADALEAARGETEAEVTHLDADDNGHGTGRVGERVAEVYRPLTAGTSTKPVGVLEIYLPYEPIAQDVNAGLRMLYRDLAAGLAVLYLLLAGISWYATGRLRRLVVRNGYLARHDQLTGLPNRAVFRSRLDAAITAAGSDGVAVAVVDVDRFKEVNDTLGHGNGDALLAELGRRLPEAVAEDDLVAHLGGDEFGIIFATSSPSSTETLADRIARVRRTVGREVYVAGLPLVVETSIGVAQSPRDGEDAELLLQHADVAMYVAKQAGSSVVHYDPSMDQYDARRLTLVGDMRRALNANELVLYFQPKIDVHTGEVDAVEALVRWNHPHRGLLTPDRFLPVVEQTGLIESLTAWVLDAALTWVASAPPASAKIRVAVNVSARNLANDGFAELVLDALADHAVASNRLAIEITETALVADRARAEASLRRLAAAGVRICVDDFGRGQTSLSQLSTMALHEVKIDQAFVRDMCDVASHGAIVRSMIELAHTLGFEVVAEGVESGTVLDALRVAGCDIAQGYHIARPMPAARLDTWLREHASARTAALDPA